MTTEFQQQSHNNKINRTPEKPAANKPSTGNIDLSKLLQKYGSKYGTSGYRITNSLTKAAKSSKQ